MQIHPILKEDKTKRKNPAHCDIFQKKSEFGELFLEEWRLPNCGNTAEVTTLLQQIYQKKGV